MAEKTGEVTIDDTFYGGEDLYSDGQIENELLEAAEHGRTREMLKSGSSWPVLYHFSDIRENLLEWYPFRKNATVLEIGAGCGALTGLLSRKAEHVTCIELSKKRSMVNASRNAGCGNVTIYIGNFKDIEPNLTETYDYITLIGVLEYASLYLDGENPYLEMLKTAKKRLKNDGRLMIAIENKMGLKYWNGAPEDHTGAIGSGLNDYSCGEHVRTFSKDELTELLREVGFTSHQMYYPVPDYKLPEAVYSECIQPRCGAVRNYRKDYDMPRLYRFNEAVLSDQICEDGMFPYFSNSFLLIAGESTQQCLFEKYSRCRKKEFRIRTEVFLEEKKWYVKKMALHQDAGPHIADLKENERKWAGILTDIQCVRGCLEQGAYVTPYIDGAQLDQIFYQYRHNPSMFTEQFLYYIRNYLTPDDGKLMPFKVTPSFIEVFGENFPDKKRSLAFTNIDLIFSNLKLAKDGRLYSFDCEWCFGFPVPYEYVVWRAAFALYDEYKAYFRNTFSREDFFAAIGISRRDADIYMNMETNFGTYVFGKNGEENYLLNYRKSAMMQNITFQS